MSAFQHNHYYKYFFILNFNSYLTKSTKNILFLSLSYYLFLTILKNVVMFFYGIYTNFCARQICPFFLCVKQYVKFCFQHFLFFISTTIQLDKTKMLFSRKTFSSKTATLQFQLNSLVVTDCHRCYTNTTCLFCICLYSNCGTNLLETNTISVSSNALQNKNFI